MQNARKIPQMLWVVLPLACLLYFYNLGAVGLIGPDEPRYASIGREMASSGDWITPRLWGAPWFEKPALLYWMIGGGFRLGLDPDLAPRLPIALLAVAFLAFYWWIVNREFGERAANMAALILATSGAWLGFSHAAVTDLPLTATFAASMLLLLPWLARGDGRLLPLSAALMGFAVLAKGLVPLALAAPVLPAVWWARRSGGASAPRFSDLFRIRVISPFLIVALPWYLACYFRNGPEFIDEFFLRHHFGRFASDALRHVQPWWFYVPVMIAAMMPWSPLLVLTVRGAAAREARRVFLSAWIVFGFVLFSASVNKLPGYILPLIPAVALSTALALEKTRRAGAWLVICALLLVVFPVAVSVLPAALASGLSSAAAPPFSLSWLVPALVAVMVSRLDAGGRRTAAVFTVAAGVVAGIVYLKYAALPAVNRSASARVLWSEIAGKADSVCMEALGRSWVYGLNYYSVRPLPECATTPAPLHLRQEEDQPPRIHSISDPHSPDTVDPQ